MRILIIGSDGFVGQHLWRELQDSGHLMAGMDIAQGNDQDARKIANVRKAIQNHQAEVVVHLAAKSDQNYGEDDVLATIRDNAGLTAVVAQATGEAGARLVYASTSEIYGDNGTAVCDEDNGPFTLPRNVFSLSKGFGEELGKLYAPDGFTTLRFSLPYGLGQAVSKSVVSNLLWQANQGLPLQVPLGGEHSWCWIGDAVRAARLVIEKGEGAFNIARDDDLTSIQTVAELACILTGADKDLIETVAAPARETVVKNLSTRRIRKLGWEPTVSLYDGMSMTLEGWVNHLNEKGEYVAPEAAIVAG